MTCIVGLKAAGSIWLGGDSAAVSGHHVRLRQDKKVFIKDRFIYGFTSSFRMGQLLRHAFIAPKCHVEEQLDDYMSGRWIDAVRSCFKDGGYSTIENNRETGGSFLVGREGRMFQVDSDFQVSEVSDDFDAVGCGEAYALGALRTTAFGPYQSCEANNPEERINLALSVAAYFSGAVRAPFTVLELG